MADEQARPLTAEELAAIGARAERAYELHMADYTVWGRDYPDIGHDYYCDAMALLATLDAWRPVLEAVAQDYRLTTLSDNDPQACNWCGLASPDNDPHSPACPVTLARRLLGQPS